MGKDSWLEYKIKIRDRLRIFSLSIIELSSILENNTASRVINYQITKSGTSVYANYRAALRARSKAEFFSKLSISVEEADETEMWLDLLISSNILNNRKVKKLYSESLELIKILASMRKNLNR